MEIGIIVDTFATDESDWANPLVMNYVRKLAEYHHVRVFPLLPTNKRQPYTIFNAAVFPGGSDKKIKSDSDGQSHIHALQDMLKKQNRNRPFDVLHAFGAGASGSAATLTGTKLNISTVVTIVGDELMALPEINDSSTASSTKQSMVRQSILNTKAIVAPAPLVHEQLRDLLPANKHTQIHLIPFGIDLNHFQMPQTQSHSRPRAFLNVGPLEPIQDQITLLRLMATLPNATLDIIGEGSLRETLEIMAGNLNLNDRVVFHGRIPYSQLPVYYQNAGFLLITARYDAFCLAAVEALACGTGVIGTPVGILPELGKTAPIGDIEALQRIIITRTRSQSERFRFRNRLIAEQDYSLDKMLAGLLSLYRSLGESTTL